jgi:hypothetical protein
VIQRAQHAGHVAQDKPGRRALGQRPARLALQVDHDQPLAGLHDLSDMQVAVHPADGPRADGVPQTVQGSPDGRPRPHEQLAPPG